MSIDLTIFSMTVRSPAEAASDAICFENMVIAAMKTAAAQCRLPGPWKFGNEELRNRQETPAIRTLA